MQCYMSFMIQDANIKPADTAMGNKEFTRVYASIPVNIIPVPN